VNCDQLRELAPELALGIADGEQRADALRHLDGCAECRREIERLSGITDELLMLAPRSEPPPGFESRVLARVAPPKRSSGRESRPRRALRVAVPALVGAALAVAVLGFAFRGDIELAHNYQATLDEGGGKELKAARLYQPGNLEAGVAFGYDGSPSWVLVTVDRSKRNEPYTAELVTRSGRRVPLPGFGLDPSTGSWGGAIPVGLDQVSEVRLIGRHPGDVIEADFDRARSD
jgi:hypothetical protein